MQFLHYAKYILINILNELAATMIYYRFYFL